MVVARRLWAVSAALVFLSACAESGDRATLAVTLGAAADALTLEGVDIRRFELRITCADGATSDYRGAVSAAGDFSVDVPTCPRATIRFRGLAADDLPALDGTVAIAIRAPEVGIAIPVRRVGTIELVNDDTYTAACRVSVANAPQYDRAFTLEPGASRDEVLPVNGTSLSCAPADTCPVETCDFDGPLATTRAVAVPFADRGRLSLANLGSSLVFSLLPPLRGSAGVTFEAFEVTLVDERGAPIARSDISVSLETLSPTTHGGFGNASVVALNGAARFDAVTFTTAGPLTFRARATVDGLLLTTADHTVDIAAGALSQILLSGPQRVVSAVTADFNIAAADAFGNLTVLPGDITLSSNDPVADNVRYTALVEPVVQFTFFTAGTRTLTARATQEPAIEGTLQLDVDPGTATSLELIGPQGSVFVAQAASFIVTARDDYDNIATGYTGTVQLAAMPGSDFTFGQPYTCMAADAGTHVFASVVFATTGQRTVEARDLANALSSPMVSVNVVDASAIQDIVVINQVPNPLVIGEQFELQVILVDINGQVIAPNGANLQLSFPQADSALLGARTFSVNNNVAVFGGLSINAAFTEAQLLVQSSPAAAGGPGTSNLFDVVSSGLCSEAHVDPAAVPINCTFNTIGSAIAATQVTSGSRILVVGGNYPEALVVSDKRLIIEGGYDTTFSPSNRDTSNNASLVFPASVDAAIEVFGSGDLTLDGMAVRAADAIGNGSFRWAVRADSGGRLVVRNSRLLGPVSDIDIIGGVAEIGSGAQAILVNNWLHIGRSQDPGEPSAGLALYGIATRGSAANVDVVHNTIYLFGAPVASALQLVANNSNVTFTNNLVIGDFQTCVPGAGICAVSEAATAAPLASAIGNHVVGLNGDNVGTTYVRGGSTTYADLNGPGTASFDRNVTTHSEQLDLIFDNYWGPDEDLYSLVDNDWHLRVDRRTGFDATQAACGSTEPPKQPCNGVATDIDGGTRASDPSAGADEFGSAPIGT